MTVGTNLLISLTPLYYGQNGTDTGANGLNNLGEAVGGSSETAVEWLDSAVIALQPLASNFTYNAAEAVNDQGQIVGYSGIDPFNAPHAALWQNGTVTYIGNPDYFSQAMGINDSGQVVGVAGPLGSAGQAFVWQNGVMTLLPDLPGVTNANASGYGGFAYGINLSGQIVGAALTSSQTDHAALWQNGTVTDLGTLPGDTSSQAFAINNAGQIVGYSQNANNQSHAFLWQNGSMTALAALAGYTDSSAEAINGAGIIVGQSANSSGSFSQVATIWENGTAIDLNTLLPQNYAGNSLTNASSINDNNQIAVSDGYGDNFVLTLGSGTAGLTAASATQSFAAGKITSSVPVLDSAANVQAHLDALQDMAAAGLINGINFTDTTLPVLTISAAQMERDGAVLEDIQSNYSLTVNGAVDASAVNATSAYALSSLTVSDSAANVAANLANLEGVAEAGALTIVLTDAGTPTLTVTAGETDTAVLAAITGPYQLALTDVGAADATQDAAQAQVVSVAISDTDFDVGQNLDALQALAAAGKLASITLQASSNVSNESNIPVLPVTVAQLTADSGAIAKIGGTFDIEITAPATGQPITGVSGHANIVSFSGAAATFNFVPSSDGHSLIVGNGTISYQLNNIQGLAFSDYELIVADMPGSNGQVTTGNITELYSAVLAREPDLAGLNFYQTYLQANPTTSLIQFAQWFLASPEYSGNPAHAYAQTTAGEAQFITDSYQNLLNRIPSAADIAYYQTNVIQPALTGLTPGTAAYSAADAQAHAQMLVYFSASPEFLSDVQVTAATPANGSHWLVLV